MVLHSMEIQPLQTTCIKEMLVQPCSQISNTRSKLQQLSQIIRETMRQVGKLTCREWYFQPKKTTATKTGLLMGTMRILFLLSYYKCQTEIHLTQTQKWTS